MNFKFVCSSCKLSQRTTLLKDLKCIESAGHVDAFCQRRVKNDAALKCYSTSQDLHLSITKRHMIEALGISGLIGLAYSKPVLADDESRMSTITIEAQPSQPMAELYVNDDFELTPPLGYEFVETDPIKVVERGPQPERSPLRCAFTSPDKTSSVSVVIRNAQDMRRTFLQIIDITQYGTPIEAASLLIPRGSRLLATDIFNIETPPRETAMGTVQLPPKAYYRYEFTTSNGLHVFISATAQRGKVYVCGGSGPIDNWVEQGPLLRKACESFRLR